MKNIKPMFIIFEGADGSGKTTLMNSFMKYLQNTQIKVINTKEPWNGHKSTYIWIRKILDKEININDYTILEFLLLMNRYHHDIWVKKMLKNGFFVLQDRSWISSIAYREIFNDEFLMKINSKFKKINLLILINTPGNVCMERINKRNYKKTLYEKEKKLDNANFRYQKFIYNCNKNNVDFCDNVLILNGMLSKNKLYEILISVWKIMF